MKKRIIPIFISLALLCALLPMSILPANAGWLEDFSWDAATGTLTVYSMDDPEGLLTGDGGQWYAENAIPWSANKDSVTTVVIGPNVKSVLPWTFFNYPNLETVVFEEGAVEIGMRAFSNCTALCDARLPKTMTKIDDYAFYFCLNLEKIEIPENVSYIGNQAFTVSCLSGISVDEANQSYSSDSFGVLFNKQKTDLLQAPGLLYGNEGKYVIPNGVTSIAAMAFQGCDNLKEVTVPGSVKSIGHEAFFQCGSLQAVYFMGDAPTLGEAVFYMTDFETWSDVIIQGLTLYYVEGKNGWTKPAWNSYPTAAWTPEEQTQPSGEFVDVPKNEWYVGAVDYAVQNGLMNGVGNDRFDPEGSMTRAMLVTVLWRYEGEPEAPANTFSDVKAGTWYSDAVSWASANGVVNGVGNNKFDPDGNITREQMATILYRYCNGKGIDTSKQASISGFPDAGSVSSYAQTAMQWAVAEKLVNGSDGKLLPQGNATRAQVATILMRFIENIA